MVGFFKGKAESFQSRENVSLSEERWLWPGWPAQKGGGVVWHCVGSCLPLSYLSSLLQTRPLTDLLMQPTPTDYFTL